MGDALLRHLRADRFRAAGRDHQGAARGRSARRRSAIPFFAAASMSCSAIGSATSSCCASRTRRRGRAAIIGSRSARSGLTRISITRSSFVIDQLSNDFGVEPPLRQHGRSLRAQEPSSRSASRRPGASCRTTASPTISAIAAAAEPSPFGASAPADNEQTSLNLDFYAQDRFYFLPQWALVLGAQVSYAKRENDDDFPVSATNPDNSDKQDWWGFSPKVGLLWEHHAERAGVRECEPQLRAAELWRTGRMRERRRGLVQLDAQTATTVEVGTRGRHGRFAWDLAYYYAWLDDELLEFQVAPGLNQTVNAGRTIHQGVEAALDVDLLARALRPRRSAATADEARTARSRRPRREPKRDRLVLRQLYLWNDFHFDGDASFGDNQLAGIPEHYYRAELLYEHPCGFYAGPNVEWVPQKLQRRFRRDALRRLLRAARLQDRLAQRARLLRLLRSEEPHRRKLRRHHRRREPRNARLRALPARRRPRLLRRHRMEVVDDRDESHCSRSHRFCRAHRAPSRCSRFICCSRAVMEQCANPPAAKHHHDGRSPACARSMSSRQGNRLHVFFAEQARRRSPKPLLFHRRSDDGGETWSDPVQVDAAEPAGFSPHRGMDPQIARRRRSPDRRLDDRGHGPLGLRADGDGFVERRRARRGSRDRIPRTTARRPVTDSSTSPRTTRAPSISRGSTAATAGKACATPARSDAGATWSANITVKAQTCECCANAIAAAPGGAVGILYRGHDPRDMHLAISNRRRARIGRKIIAPAASTGNSRAARTSAAAWLLVGKRRFMRWCGPARILDPASSICARKRVAPIGPSRDPLGDANATHPDLAADGKGRLAAVWDASAPGGRAAIWSAISADGTRWHKPIRLSAEGSASTHPRVVATHDGFRVFWTETPESGPAVWKSGPIRSTP